MKLEEGLNCGGAYLKFLRDSPSLRSSGGYDMSALDNSSPFSIMFGPDNCGVSNNQVHFIMQHRSDPNGPFVEKFFNDTPPVALDSNTHLYTLALRADNTAEFYVDMQKASDRISLFESMNPPVNPPLEIDDPTDLKPADWVDEPSYPDPTAVKPEDWDDDAPPKIPDLTVVKPSGWDDSVPADIPDPEAVKPADWDDEEDGEWEAPMVPNPLCDSSGCGVWQPPMVKNPAFRGGKWKPRMIANPAYKWEWKAKQIPNPDASRDDKPLDNMEPIIGVAVEVWTTVGGIHLDNIVIARSLDDAFNYAEKTFLPKQIQEGKEEAEARRLHKQQQRDKKLESGTFKDLIEVHMGDFAEAELNLVFIFSLTIGCVLFSSYLLMGWGEDPDPQGTIHNKKHSAKRLETEAEDDNGDNADSLKNETKKKDE